MYLVLRDFFCVGFICESDITAWLSRDWLGANGGERQKKLESSQLDR